VIVMLAIALRPSLAAFAFARAIRSAPGAIRDRTALAAGLVYAALVAWRSGR
jgi:hypothetical protein